VKQTELEETIKEIRSFNHEKGCLIRTGEVLPLWKNCTCSRKYIAHAAVKEFVKSEEKRIALDRKKLLLGFGKDKEGDKK